MTPEASQDLQAYFGMNLFGDEEEEQTDNDMEEQKLRHLIRETIHEIQKEDEIKDAFDEAEDELGDAVEEIQRIRRALPRQISKQLGDDIEKKIQNVRIRLNQYRDKLL